MPLKDADQKAGSVDPDQTAPRTAPRSDQGMCCLHYNVQKLLAVLVMKNR